MNLLHRTSRAILLLSLLFVMPTIKEAEGSGWKRRDFSGRSYVPLDQIAAFYEMRVDARDDVSVDGFTLISETRSMEFSSGSREARIDGVKHWLSFPIIVEEGQVYVSRMDLAKTIDPLMRPERIPGLKPVHTVVLDPGHGGHDRGAVNRYGSEKNYNLDLCRRIRPYLQEAGLRVVITRSRDEFISLDERLAVAGKLGEGTVFVSVHFNDAATRNSPGTGFEIFTLTPRGAPRTDESVLSKESFTHESGHRFDPSSQALSGAIYHAMLGRLPMFDGGMKRARFAELRNATTPAVLIKCGFMTSPRDAQLIHNLPWRERLADSIARGIIEYRNLTRSRKPPKLLAQYRVEEAEAFAEISEQESSPSDYSAYQFGDNPGTTQAPNNGGTMPPVQRSDDFPGAYSPIQNESPKVVSLSVSGAELDFVWISVATSKREKSVEIGDFGGRHPREKKRSERIYAPFERHGGRGYYLGKTEVTGQQWAAVMGEGPRSNLPVVGKTYSEIQVFLEKLNAMVRATGGVPHTPDGAQGILKLPTEAEWEYAARGAEGPRYADQDPYDGDLERYEVFFLPGSDGKAKEVGSRPPNPLGLHDMLGNVRELMDGSYSVGGVSGGGFLLKGGSYLSERDELRSSARTEHQRLGKDGKSTRRPDAGLRLCISADLITSLDVPLPEFGDFSDPIP